MSDKEYRTDIYGEFAIWLWGKKMPMEIFEAQKFIRNSPLGEYVKELESRSTSTTTIRRKKMKTPDDETIMKSFKETVLKGTKQICPSCEIRIGTDSDGLCDVCGGRTCEKIFKKS